MVCAYGNQKRNAVKVDLKVLLSKMVGHTRILAMHPLIDPDKGRMESCILLIIYTYLA